MILTRPCGHREGIPGPENKERFLRESGRRCRKCREERRSGKGAENRDWLPRPMAMARDLWRE